MKVFMVPQASDSWWEVKRGIPSASDFDKIITPSKGELSKSARSYIASLLADLHNPSPNYFSTGGKPVNTYAMQNGADTEPEARLWFQNDLGEAVQEVGFIVADDFSIGCSPDGVLRMEFNNEATGELRGHPYFDCTSVGATLELKCPLDKTHAEYLLDGVLPQDYKPQVHGHMVVTGCDYVEFVSYCRFLPPLRVKVERDSYTDKVAKALADFSADYAAAKLKILKMKHEGSK